MAFRKINYLLLGGLFLVQTFALPISVPELVLCVADDHVRLELKNVSDDCGHEEFWNRSLNVWQHDFHADNCIDVPLYQHVKHVVIKNAITNVFTGNTTFFVLDSDKTGKESRVVSLSNGFPSFSLQRSICSVVLLI